MNVMMLELYGFSPRTPGDKERVKREIESTDRAVDRLIYELSPAGMIYGLMEDNVKVVKGAR